MIITIAREFGSGGRELGKRLADILGYTYYDKDSVISLAKSKDNNYYENALNYSAVTPYVMHNTFSLYPFYYQNQTRFLNAQQKVLLDIAKHDNCIIIGRGADVILKSFNPVKIFVYAEKQAKIKRCLLNAPEGEKLTAEDYARKMKRIDRARKKIYATLGGDKWGARENYDFLINASDIEIKKLAPIVADLIKLYNATEHDNK